MNRRPWEMAMIASGFDLFPTAGPFRPKVFALSWRLFLIGIVGLGFPGSAADGNLVLDRAFSARVARHGEVRVLAVQPDGKIVVAGDFSQVDSVPRDGLARLKADGSLDPTFVPPTDLGWRVSALHVQANGVILLGGSFPSDRSNPFTGDREFDAFRRLNADGSLDTRFYPIFRSGPFPSVPALVPDVNSRFVSLHNYEVFGGGVQSVDYAIYRFEEATGDSVALARTDGTLAAASRFPDGGLVVAGGFHRVQSIPRDLIAKLSADGTVDPGFAPRFSGGSQTRITSVGVTAGNRILVGGDFATVNDQPRPGIARLLPDGTPDPAFDPMKGSGFRPGSLNGIGGWAIVSGLWPQPDGKVLVAGYFSELQTYRLVRLLTSGAVDSTWVLPTTHGFAFNAVAPGGDGLLIGGKLGINGGAGTALLKTSREGTVDRSFVAMVETPGGAEAVEPQPDGKLLVGGSFSSVNGVPRANLARLNRDGTLDASFANALVSGRIARILAGPDGKIWLGGEFPELGVSVRRGLARLNHDGTPDRSFNALLSAGSFATDLALTTDGKLFACGRLQPSGSGARELLRFNPNGTVDSTFRLPLLESFDFQYPSIVSLASLPDNRLMIGGSFARVGGVARPAVARLRNNGQLDPAFDAGPISSRRAIAAKAERVRLDASGRVVIAGWFDQVAGQPRGGVARLAPDGALDHGMQLSFEPIGAVALSVNASGMAAVGEIAGERFCVFRPTGEVWLNGTGGTSAGLDATAVTADGEVILAGPFATVENRPALGLARLIQSAQPPEIIQHPSPKVVGEGEAIVLTVVASGREPLTYQWWRGETLLSGNTLPTLTVAPGLRRDSGLYRVRVQDPDGQTDQAEAFVRVLPQVEARLLPSTTANEFWLIGRAAQGDPPSDAELMHFLTEGSTDFQTWAPVSDSWVRMPDGDARLTQPLIPEAASKWFRIRRK